MAKDSTVLYSLTSLVELQIGIGKKNKLPLQNLVSYSQSKKPPLWVLKSMPTTPFAAHSPVEMVPGCIN